MCQYWNEIIIEKTKGRFFGFFGVMSAISWRPVLVVEEAGVSGENHRPWASNR
jgi:hypothetical protein